MFSLKSESAFVVIKPRGFPVLRGMAPCAISNTVDSELTVMIVGMAGATLARQSYKFLVNDPFRIFSEVTLTATLPVMSSG